MRLFRDGYDLMLLSMVGCWGRRIFPATRTPPSGDAPSFSAVITTSFPSGRVALRHDSMYLESATRERKTIGARVRERMEAAEAADTLVQKAIAVRAAGGVKQPIRAPSRLANDFVQVVPNQVRVVPSQATTCTTTCTASTTYSTGPAPSAEIQALLETVLIPGCAAERLSRVPLFSTTV